MDLQQELQEEIDTSSRTIQTQLCTAYATGHLRILWVISKIPLTQSHIINWILNLAFCPDPTHFHQLQAS